MQGLSERTWKIIQKMFPTEQHQAVGELLASDCSNNLPWMKEYDAVSLERIQFAVLKLSGGNLDRLLQAIQSAQTDWRDTLMAADFANRTEHHDQWGNAYLAAE